MDGVARRVSEIVYSEALVKVPVETVTVFVTTVDAYAADGHSERHPDPPTFPDYVKNDLWVSLIKCLGGITQPTFLVPTQ